MIGKIEIEQHYGNYAKNAAFAERKTARQSQILQTGRIRNWCCCQALENIMISSSLAGNAIFTYRFARELNTESTALEYGAAQGRAARALRRGLP
ncbi:MAG: hypothetical protein H6695_08040 [Deferribacteres bacterium]|nr:hypothetical protein [candidate division KSB1 bacterium]MCB9510117.1 hypothetical protein [Deferribacteres bacterium]